MNPDPATDVIAFLTKPAWYTSIFWLLLLLASVAIALYVLARIPEQRSGGPESQPADRIGGLSRSDGISFSALPGDSQLSAGALNRCQ